MPAFNSGISRICMGVGKAMIKMMEEARKLRQNDKSKKQRAKCKMRIISDFAPCTSHLTS